MAQHEVDDSDAAAECADALARRTIDELCEEWATATDADTVGELADELAKRALDVRDPEDVARLCSAIVARLNGSKSDDDEIAAVLDAVTCGPLGTPGALGCPPPRQQGDFSGDAAGRPAAAEIGRASCRERV